ncbi:MAG: ABC transporter permease subunit [Eubacteriales bacterium]
MNILKQELLTNLKIFFFWTMGLVVFVFAGITKFTGIQEMNIQDMMEIFNEYPKIVLAIFGMPSGLDVTVFSGYYFVLNNYIIILICLYSIQLAVKAVTRESVDKTSEFLFTKPVTRSYILSMKLIASYVYVAIYCILNYVFTIIAMEMIGVNNEEMKTIVFRYFGVSLLLGTLFFATTVLISSGTKQIEKGAMYSNYVFFLAFGMGVVFDSLEETKYVQLISPLRYFPYEDVLSGEFKVGYIITCVVIIIISLIFGYRLFCKKDEV